MKEEQWEVKKQKKIRQTAKKGKGGKEGDRDRWREEERKERRGNKNWLIENVQKWSGQKNEPIRYKGSQDKELNTGRGVGDGLNWRKE